MGEPRTSALRDAPNRAASVSASSEGNSAALMKAEAEERPNKAASDNGSDTPALDLSSLKDAIQSPTKPGQWKTVTKPKSASKKRRMKARAKAAAQRAVAVDAVRHQLGTCPKATKPKGEASTSGTKAPATASTSAALTVGLHKRSMKPRGRKKTRTYDDKTAPRPQKRTRPEDTVTPKGEGKKPRTAGVMGRGPTSYAEAAASFLANELCVAVMVEPFTDLIQDQAEDLRRQIEGKLRLQVKADLKIPAATRKDLKFRGKAHFADGVLKTWCEDAYTLAWLEKSITDIVSPVEGSRLVVRPQSAIPKKVPCLLFVPGEIEDLAELRELLAGQNSNMSINSWTLTHERIREDPPGTCLFFRIPEKDVEVLKAQDRRVYYLMGNIYVRFLDTDVSHQTPAAASKQTEATSLGEQETEPEPTTSAMDVETAAEDVEAPTAMEVQIPSSPRIISDEECFPAGGGESEASDSLLYSSPLRED
ncbi:uncharacterized protein LOC131850158 [Achroia grisella]|uniref:uncharacterized protein LOC131850158 n=1 Tax=Achroia grisella TaxID=688607 RepID=UPI0027D2A93D|nr:uncharacterized protein LOC131850158 [Achroia grisella]